VLPDQEEEMKGERVVRLCALVLAIAALGAASAAWGSTTSPYIQARVQFSSMEDWRGFLKLQDLDIVKSKPGVGVTIVTNPEQLASLVALGYNVTVEIDDMESYYASRVRGPNFGQFHTYSETSDFLDALHASYPAITTAKFSIGTSREGRTLWAIKISDNAGVDESEPEVCFDGLHHAREPMGIETQLNYMTWLCQNYGADSEATFLVDSREIFFVPIINPDGYCYNESTNPTGGGMWRKNRRVNTGGCYGVDLNRNYPYMWGYSGSSTDPCSDTYQGPSAGSEPEIQAYMNFVAARDFVTNISFHSVAGLVLLPWSYDYTVHTPDDALFRVIANEMATTNGYDVGQPGEVLYDCSGTTTDWEYQAHGVLSLCIEVGGSDFWPLESEIEGLSAETLYPQIYATRIAGSYLAVTSSTLTGGNGNGKPDPGETLSLTVSVKNQGVIGSVANTVVTLVTDDPYVQLNDASSSLGTIAPGSTVTNSGDPFSFTVDPTTPAAHGLRLTVIITGTGFYGEKELSWMVGDPVTLFFDNMESGISKWTESDGLWGLSTTSYHSASNSYTDSPSGNYGNSRNTWIEFANPLNLSHATSAILSFWHRYNTEANYDFCYVEVSSNGGTSWHQVGPRYSGDNGGWQFVELPIDDYTGTASFKARFRFTSDSYVVDDGWYVDDVRVAGPAAGNGRPTAPILLAPPDGGTVSTSTPTLSVTNATDPDPGSTLTYAFIVYSDELRTHPVASVSGVAQGAGSTSWTLTTALDDATYWWTAYAYDGTERGPLMDTASFTVEGSGVDDGAIAKLVLHPARPNPFGAETTLAFELPERTNVSLAVYSVDGRLVRTLLAGEAGPGATSVVWDGRDERGASVGNGLYFVKLEAGGEVRHGKLAVMR
jgi:carboxypeptidase T